MPRAHVPHALGGGRRHSAGGQSPLGDDSRLHAVRLAVMLNLYKSQLGRSRQEYTGHDRFSQQHPDRRKRRPVLYQRSASASELQPLAKLFSCVTNSKSTPNNDNEKRRGGSRRRRNSAAALLQPNERFSRRKYSTGEKNWGSLRKYVHGGRYEYMALEGEGGGAERLEMERKAKEEANTACSHYLKGCPRYTLLEHLKDIGSRVDKHWFVVRDTSVKTERLLTLVPKNPSCPVKTDQETRSTILELLLNLQHPYIYPVLDLEFTDVGPNGLGTYIVLVIPYNSKGSLKDLIYKSVWQDDWADKYGEKSEGLPASQVQRLGRQILEALLFLKERGYPSCSHLHSGNIIIQNGVARLSGLENVLFGFTSRIYPVISKSFRSDPSVIDVVCFGHVLFEMCAGYELTVAVPTTANLLDIASYPQVVEVLEFIFNNPKQRCPSIEELLLSDFFRNIDLREMRATSLPQVYHAHLTASTLALLNDIKRNQRPRRGRRSHSSSTDANSPAASQQHRYRDGVSLDDCRIAPTRHEWETRV